MTTSKRGFVKALGVSACAALVLSACGGGSVTGAENSNKQNVSANGGQPCAPFNMALNDWVGYTADAYVIGEIATKQLGCTVDYKNLAEQLSWAGFADGSVDVIMENWGHQDLAKKYITDQHVAQDAGLTGNKGVIGWFVPPWLAKAHPDITNWKNLNKYASNFATSESGGQGQLLDGDPSFVTNDEALVSNLNLNFKVVYAGSEAALIQAFRDAEKNHTWMIGYFYEPQWFLSEVPLVKVNLPKYTTGCDSDPQKVNCDYPIYHLDKIVSSSFAKSSSPAYNLVKNFQWTNDDQNLVAKYIAADGMKPQDAADKWIAANPDKVNAWLGK